MTQDIDLKELENKAWKSTFQDGLWDIMLGLVFFIPPVTGLLKGSDYTLIPLYLVSILLFVIVKKRITVPRIGLVKFGEKRRKKSHIVVFILTASVAFFMILMVLINKQGLKYELEGIPVTSFIVGINILIVLGCMAYFLNFDRLYIYAVLIGVTEPLSNVLENMDILEGPYLMLLVISSGMIVTGATLLVRFMQQYPLHEGEV